MWRASLSCVVANLKHWALAAWLSAGSLLVAQAECTKPVYLTFDTGHMGVAPLIADVLARHGIQATFFLANEATLTHGTSLDDEWAPWWRNLAQQGHLFGSHTWDHLIWRADQLPGFKMKPGSGLHAGEMRYISPQEYCQQLEAPAQRFEVMTGQKMAHIFRAPAGKTSPALLKVAQACGWQHVPWSPAGFLGDELPSERYPNTQLLEQAVRSIRPGDILLAHLGIWSRQIPWAPEVLEPLIVELKQKGFCFATLREHPLYKAWLESDYASKAHPSAAH